MVMVSYINKLRNGGMELHEAVITGASVRLRAELLSAVDRQHQLDTLHRFRPGPEPKSRSLWRS